LVASATLVACHNDSKHASSSTKQNSGTYNPGYSSSSTSSNDSYANGMQSQSDSEFLRKAAIGGMTEVELGRLAAEKGANDAVRDHLRMAHEAQARASAEEH